MKKLIALLLVFGLLFSVATLFAGCDDSGKGKNQSSKNDDEDDEGDAGDNGSSEPSESDPDASEPSGTGGNTGDPDDPTKPDNTDVTSNSTEPSEPTEPKPTEPDDPTEPHSHSYGSWTVVKNATCTATGTRTRSCSCGDKETETIPMLAHSYVDGICKDCGKENFSHTLTVINGLQIDQSYYCSEKVITYKANDKCYMADHSGKILTPGGYDYMLCANQKGYVVAYNETSEILDSEDYGNWGFVYTTRYVQNCYVLDEKGTVVFETQYTFIQDEISTGETTYSGEYIISCNDDRIVTCLSDTYYMGMARTTKTVNIYNMQGSRLAQFTNVLDVGTYINGKLIMYIEDYEEGHKVLVVDKNGRELCSSTSLDDDIDCVTFDNVGWTNKGFVGGYAMFAGDRYSQVMLFNENLSKSYLISAEYLGSTTNNGTIVVSKIETGSGISTEYYLIDLAKCSKDADGYCVPTINAAVSRQGYDEISISCLFGETEKYALVSRDGKWGYLAMDGSVEKLYDDAGSFYDGRAIVKDGNRIYIIDENFKQISNSLTGYTSVSSALGNVYNVFEGEIWKLAVLS